MKHMRRAFALILTLALVMSFGITAFAAEPTGTIKVENTINGNEYKVYRIFDLVMQKNGGTDTYAYSANTAWTAFIETVTYNAEVVNANAMVRVGADGFYHACDKDGKYVDTASTTWAANFGKLVKDWLGKKTVKEVATLVGNGGIVSQADLAYGYYYVSTTNGSLVALNTLDSTDSAEVTIGDKNVTPTLSKVIVEDTDVAANTAAVGDTVNFKLNLVITQDTLNHVVHDVLSKGLTRNNDIVVTLKRAPAITKTLVANTDYKVSAAARTADGKGTEFNITFLAAADLQKDDALEITYSAVVNKDALKHTGADNKMTNTAKLHYSTTADSGVTPPNPDVSTEPDLPSVTPEVKTATYNFNVTVQKFTGESTSATLLAGAKFKLFSTTDGKTGYTFTENKTGVYDLDSATAGADNVTLLTTDNKGNLSLNGLDAGTYYLEEVEAPAGYNKPADRFAITITASNPTTESSSVAAQSGEITLAPAHDELPGTSPTVISGVVAIQNNKGNELPHTGGVGTTIFYVCGAVLMASALVLLITKKKMASN